MHTGTGRITEIYLDGSAHIECPSNLIPAPGQYVLAQVNASDLPLPGPLFFYDSAPNGFRFTPPLPISWTIGTKLNLRGPLGHGFSLTDSLRKIAFVAFDDSVVRLHGLISAALKQSAEVVLVCDVPPQDLAEDVEVQPLKALEEVCKWADFIAIDSARENLNQLESIFGNLYQLSAVREAQVLIRTAMPCGGVAECGVCAIRISHDWMMTCKEGPVFVLKDIFNTKL